MTLLHGQRCADRHQHQKCLIIGGHVLLQNNASLETLDVRNLQSVAKNFVIQGGTNFNAQTLLESIGGNFTINNTQFEHWTLTFWKRCLEPLICMEIKVWAHSPFLLSPVLFPHSTYTTIAIFNSIFLVSDRSNKDGLLWNESLTSISFPSLASIEQVSIHHNNSLQTFRFLHHHNKRVLSYTTTLFWVPYKWICDRTWTRPGYLNSIKENNALTSLSMNGLAHLNGELRITDTLFAKHLFLSTWANRWEHSHRQ